MSNQIDVNMIIDEPGKYGVTSYIDNHCIRRYLNVTSRPHRRDDTILIDNNTVRNWSNLITVQHLSADQRNRPYWMRLRGGRCRRDKNETCTED